MEEEVKVDGLEIPLPKGLLSERRDDGREGKERLRRSRKETGNLRGGREEMEVEEVRIEGRKCSELDRNLFEAGEKI